MNPVGTTPATQYHHGERATLTTLDGERLDSDGHTLAPRDMNDE